MSQVGSLGHRRSFGIPERLLLLCTCQRCPFYYRQAGRKETHRCSFHGRRKRKGAEATANKDRKKSFILFSCLIFLPTHGTPACSHVYDFKNTPSYPLPRRSLTVPNRFNL